MSNPLDPIWDAHRTIANALKAVRRCTTVPGTDPERIFRNTRFHRLPASACAVLLDSAQDQIRDQTVFLLYAVFEGALRDHLARQSHLLLPAGGPDPQFGKGLAQVFQAHCDDIRMDVVAKLFADAAGQDLVAKAGSIRTYRHWIAHGRRGEAPPTVSPQFAYQALTDFLQRCGLA